MPSRHALRLRGYDYASRVAYCVTLCARERVALFGSIVGGEVSPNPVGKIVRAQWNALPDRFPGVELDEFVVMPNHIHGIIVVTSRDVVEPARVGATLAVAPDASRDVQDAVDAGALGCRATVKVAPTLGSIIGAYKSMCVHACLKWIGLHEPARRLGPLWQRGYYDHIIRDEPDLQRIRQYILDNPLAWASDRENPLVAGPRAVPLAPRDPWRV